MNVKERFLNIQIQFSIKQGEIKIFTSNFGVALRMNFPRNHYKQHGGLL